MTAEPVDAAPVAAGPAGLRAGYVAAMADLAGGVTIVTAYDGQGRPAGLTATSAVSVAADPPLVAVSLSGGSATLRAVRASGRFCVNILSLAGRPTAQAFASRAGDKFRGVVTEPGPGGPGLPELSTHTLHCDVTAQVPAGDHVLLLGRVRTIRTGRPVGDSGRGLVYWRRRWHELR